MKEGEVAAAAVVVVVVVVAAAQALSRESSSWPIIIKVPAIWTLPS